MKISKISLRYGVLALTLAAMLFGVGGYFYLSKIKADPTATNLSRVDSAIMHVKFTNLPSGVAKIKVNQYRRDPENMLAKSTSETLFSSSGGEEIAITLTVCKPDGSATKWYCFLNTNDKYYSIKKIEGIFLNSKGQEMSNPFVISQTSQCASTAAAKCDPPDLVINRGDVTLKTPATSTPTSTDTGGDTGTDAGTGAGTGSGTGTGTTSPGYKDKDYGGDATYSGETEVGTGSGVGVGVSIPTDPTKSKYTYSCYVKTVYDFSLVIGAFLVTIMIIYAGVKYITSQGSQNQINDAKDIILGTLLGFAILVIIKLILNILGPQFPTC